MGRAHTWWLPLLLAVGLTRCTETPPESSPPPLAAEEEEALEAQWGPSCPRAFLVKEILPGTSSAIGHMADVAGTYFFTADDGIHGDELWKSDGTAAGTTLIKDITPGSAGTPFADSRAVGRLYFFFLFDFAREMRELWRSDGTEEGTFRIATFPDVSWVSEYQGKLLFVAATPEYGSEPWVSDGTPEGTRLLIDVNPGPASSNPTLFREFRGDLLFGAHPSGDATRHSLLRLDRRGRLTELYSLEDPSAGIFQLTVVGKRIFFLVGFFEGERVTLMTSDGRPGGARPLHDFFGTSEPRELTALGDTLLFIAHSEDTGTELWRSDGTPEGTVLVKDIWPGPRSGASSGLTVLKDRVYFPGLDPEHGLELWVSDGTTEGTVLAADINPGPANSQPTNLTPVNKRLYFAADDGVHGGELWKLDRGVPKLVADIAPGPASSLEVVFFSSGPSAFIRSGEYLFFVADDGIHGPELWASPITPGACR